MSDQVEVKLLKSQHEFIFSDALYCAIVGGLGSGKSEAGVHRAIKLKIDSPDEDLAYYLPTYDLINLMAMPRFEEMLIKLGLTYKINKSNYRIDISGYSSIILRSMQNANRIVSYQTSDAIIDELDTLKKEDASDIWRKVSERTRAKKKNGLPNTISVVTTPDMGDTGFCYSKWGGDLSINNTETIEEKEYTKFHLVSASTYDNVYLPSGYVSQIKQNYDPVLADLYLSGKFVSLNQNKVYYCYDKLKHDTDKTKDGAKRLLIGLDFNIGACCYCVYVRETISDRSNDYYGKYAYYMVEEGFGHDTRELVNIFTSKYSDFEIELFPDATGKKNTTNASESDISILRESFSVNAPAGNGLIRDRVASANALFSQNRLYINSLACPKSSNAFKSQGWGKDGKPDKHDNHDGGAVDDFTDAGTYAIVRLEGITRPIIKTHSIRFN